MESYFLSMEKVFSDTKLNWSSRVSQKSNQSNFSSTLCYLKGKKFSRHCEWHIYIYIYIFFFFLSIWCSQSGKLIFSVTLHNLSYNFITGPFYSSNVIPRNLFLHTNKGMTWVLEILVNKKYHFASCKFIKERKIKQNRINTEMRL
jgi:hypothetical protein